MPTIPNIPVKYLIAFGALIAFALLIWAYGNARENAGVEKTDAKWEAAGERLAEEAKQAASSADRAAADRAASEFERVKQEKERLDEATDAGSSPWDVMFGG